MLKGEILKEIEIKNALDEETILACFTLVKEFDKLPWQHMMFFGKSDFPLND